MTSRSGSALKLFGLALFGFGAISLFLTFFPDTLNRSSGDAPEMRLTNKVTSSIQPIASTRLLLDNGTGAQGLTSIEIYLGPDWKAYYRVQGNLVKLDEKEFQTLFPHSNDLILSGVDPEEWLELTKDEPDGLPVQIVSALCGQRVEVGLLSAGVQDAEHLALEDACQSLPPKIEAPQWARVSLLGFQAGEKMGESIQHADSMGYKMSDSLCQARHSALHYSDCSFTGPEGEALQLSFFDGQLQRINYDFSLAVYDDILREISKSYGNPTKLTDPHDGSDISSEWGKDRDHFSISLGKKADEQHGYLLFVLTPVDAGGWPDHLRTTTSGVPRS